MMNSPLPVVYPFPAWRQSSITAKDFEMTIAPDPHPALAQYAHPERLVTTEWLEAHLGDEGLVIVECDEDVLLYEMSHVPGAVKLDWHTDLNDPVERDFLQGPAMAMLLSHLGISRSDTIVIYGDKNNWWAAYALWIFSLFGHEDVRLLDGGRDAWLAEARPVTRERPDRPTTEYPVVVRNDQELRAYRDDVRSHLGRPLIDVRSPAEYTGERTSAPEYPEEGALRAGHVPTAQNVPWARAVADDARFRSFDELAAIYHDEVGITDGDEVIVYCRIGERSAHTWFVLTHLLGHDTVRNYDGSWSEWGSLVGAPVARGSEAGLTAVRA
jgi:thiosulfate/3-mercaptopyruvate sulfurtransferase